MEGYPPDGVISSSSPFPPGKRLECRKRLDPIPLLEGGRESWTKFYSERCMVWT